MLSRNSCQKPQNVHDTRPYRIENNQRVTLVETFVVFVSTHVTLRMFILQVLATKLHFLADRNAVRYTVAIARAYCHVQIIITVKVVHQ